MIIKGKGRTNAGDLGAYLGDYLEHEKNEKVAVLEIRGSAFHDLHRSLSSWEAEAQGTRCKNAIWHAQMRTPHGESLTREQQLEAVDILERHLGFQAQPRAIVIHTKDGHEHIHVAWSRIRRNDAVVTFPDGHQEVQKAGRAIRDNFTHKKNVAAAREIELRFGLEQVASPEFEKEGTRRERREAAKKAPGYGDYQKAKRSGLDPTERKKSITSMWQRCDSGSALRQALQEAGYILARGDSRNFVVVDEAGDIHSLARQIKGAFARDVNERLKDLDPASVPKAEHIRQQRYFAWKEKQSNPEHKQRSVHPGSDGTESSAKAERPEPGARTIGNSDTRGKEPALLEPSEVLAGLTRGRSTFTKEDLRYEIAHRRDSLDLSPDPSAVEAIATAVTKHDDFIRLGEDRVGRSRYTSREMLETELAMRDSSDYLAVRKQHAVRPNVRDHAPSAEKLGTEQRQAFEHVTSAAAISIVIGYAGTGKSTMLGAAREAWEAEGYRVRGVALAGMAAQSLQEGSRIESRTLQSLFCALDRLSEHQARLEEMDGQIARFAGKSQAQRKVRFDMQTRRDEFAARVKAVRLTSRDIIVLDEAAMVGSRQMNQLLELARTANAKVVLVGDAEQLQAIDAGGAFRALTERHGAVKISEIRRQEAPWAKQATKDFGDGYTREALGEYRAKQHIHQLDGHEEARSRVIADWTASRASNPDDTHLMLAFTRNDVAELNAKAREAYRSEGRLGIEETIKTDAGRKEFARGDRFYFLQNDTRLQVKNGSLGTLEKIERSSLQESHRLTVRLDSGKQVAFNTSDYGKFSHGYAATIHKSQGATAKRSHVLASRYMDRHAAYVAMSRHIKQADLYYAESEFRDFEQLAKALSRDRRKDTTLDYLHRAEAAGRPEKFWNRVNKVVKIVTREESRKRAWERMAEKIRLRNDPGAKAETVLRRTAAAQAAKLRDVLSSYPGQAVNRKRTSGPSP